MTAERDAETAREIAARYAPDMHPEAREAVCRALEGAIIGAIVAARSEGFRAGQEAMRERTAVRASCLLAEAGPALRAPALEDTQ